MSGQAQSGLTASGSVILPNAPPKSGCILFEHHAGNWHVMVEYLATCRISATCKDVNGNTVTAESCVITNTDSVPGPLTVLLRGNGTLDIRFFGQLVGSTDQTQPLPESISIASGSAENGDGEVDCFAALNAEAHVDRQKLFSRAVTRAGRKPGGKEFDFNKLLLEVKVLEETIRLVELGATHHHMNIARSISLLLIPVQWGNQLGLIQRCSAHIDAPLIVYTDRRPRDPIPIVPHCSLMLNISGTPSGHLQNPIDIDVWLSLVAGHAQGMAFSNYDALKAIGDTVARHADPDWHPIVEMLQKTHSSFVDGPRYDFLAHYVLEVGKAVLCLSEDLLRKA